MTTQSFGDSLQRGHRWICDTTFNLGNVRLINNTFGIVVYTFLSFYVTINIRLAVFNLLPIPPLDGSKILFLFLPDRWVAKFYQYQQIISIALIALLWAGVLSVPLDFLSGLLGKGLSWLAWLPFSPFV